MQSSRKSRTPARGLFLWVALLVAVAVAVLLLTQRALAASAGAFVAQLWVSVMDAVLRLIAAMFGG